MAQLIQAPLVVGTIAPDGLAALAAAAAGDRIADIVEARFDLATAAGAAAPNLGPFLTSCRLLEQSGTPVLATIRLVADGGRFAGDAQRLPLFKQALETASWVDIEVESAIAADIVAIARARAGGRRVIVSHHDFSGTPDTDALEGIAARARALGADIVKIATLVRGPADHDRLIDLLRRRRDAGDGALALVGMGPMGTSLRTYLPSVGSRLTYAYLDQAVAPGQISAREMVRRLIADCPAYAAHRGGQEPA